MKWVPPESRPPAAKYESSRQERAETVVSQISMHTWLHSRDRYSSVDVGSCMIVPMSHQGMSARTNADSGMIALSHLLVLRLSAVVLTILGAARWRWKLRCGDGYAPPYA